MNEATWTSRSVQHTQSQTTNLIASPLHLKLSTVLVFWAATVFLSVPPAAEQFDSNRSCYWPFDNYYIQWRNCCIKVFCFRGKRYIYDRTIHWQMAIGHFSTATSTAIVSNKTLNSELWSLNCFCNWQLKVIITHARTHWYYPSLYSCIFPYEIIFECGLLLIERVFVWCSYIDRGYQSMNRTKWWELYMVLRGKWS
jgi:hypothetical protein